MDIINKFYNTPIITEQHTLPSVKDALSILNIFEINVDFEAIISDIIANIPEKCLDTFLSTLTYVNKSHLTYHHEPYGYHALFCGLVTAHICEKYGGNPEIGFRLGFLHDIGKPFCESVHGITFGHGQVGVHLANLLFGNIDDETKTVLLFLIDQHMCVCTHHLQTHTLCYEVLSSMMSNFTPMQKVIFNIYYKSLVIGDRTGVISSRNMTISDAHIIATYSLNSINKCHTIPKNSGSMIMVMHGTPGCGKSYAAKQITQILATYGISVGIAERDWVFWMMARRQKLIDYTITFEQYIEEQIQVNDQTTTRYKQFYPILRKSITDSYRAVIEDFREKYDLVIIDSCISLDMHLLSTLVLPQDSVFVWYGFPQHMLGNGGSLKIDVQVNYPMTNGTFYRSTIEGAPDTLSFRPLVCSAMINQLATLIGRMWSTRPIKTSVQIVHPVKYLNNNKTLDNLKAETPYLIVDAVKSYVDSNFNAIRLSYRDGTQNGNGPILHFRGETIIQDKKTFIWHPLRVSLPVTPETGQFRRFNSHAPVYKYLTGLKQYLKSEFTEPPYIPEETKFNRCFILPKVDGSLLTAWCIKKDSPQGIYISGKKDIAGQYLVEVDDCYVGIGSKSTLFLTQTLDFEIHFYNSIISTFKTIHAFAQKVKSYLDTLEWTETASVIFEVVPEHPYSGLTVDYGRAFTTHLSTVIYHNSNTRIILPDSSSMKYFESLPYVELDCNADTIAKYYAKKMDDALDGKIEDLEGFMIAFTSDDGDLLYVKLKFPWYYAAHKPDTNFQTAEELSFNPKYDKIRDKLVNLALSAEKREARRNPELVFMPFAKMLGKAIFDFNAIHKPVNKKDFMLKFNCSTYFSNYPGIEDTVKGAFAKLYINCDYNIDRIVPSLWDKVSAMNPNDNIKYGEYIVDFVIKTWHIKAKF
jgi:hypothetical protein